MQHKSREELISSLVGDDYHRPINCAICGGIMIFKGVGEYECEDCHNRDYDDYGKVRLYIEGHRGATALEVENETGVSQKTIRKMLREERLEVAADSKTFLRCEVCGDTIRSGMYCAKCRVNVNRMLEDQAREQKKKNLSGVGMGDTRGAQSGEKRFIRSKDRI